MTCPNCRTVNPGAARFCFNCGAALGASPAAEGERRLVTVLFADVVGSTSWAERVDPEEWTEIMNGALAFMIRAVTRFEGTVARLMGDGVLALFGAPVAHEDDAERAVLAALSMRDAAADYSTRLARFGQPFALRVGINTGLSVLTNVGDAAKSEYTAMGDSANLAARLAGGAGHALGRRHAGARPGAADAGRRPRRRRRDRGRRARPPQRPGRAPPAGGGAGGPPLGRPRLRAPARGPRRDARRRARPAGGRHAPRPPHAGLAAAGARRGRRPRRRGAGGERRAREAARRGGLGHAVRRAAARRGHARRHPRAHPGQGRGEPVLPRGGAAFADRLGPRGVRGRPLARAARDHRGGHPRHAHRRAGGAHRPPPRARARGGADRLGHRP